MISPKIKQAIGSKYADMFPNEYLSKEESDEVWKEVQPLTVDEEKRIYAEKGIDGYDSEKGLLYRKNFDVTTEELHLLIQLDNNKKITTIKAILQAIFFTALGVMVILGFLGLWPLLILAIVIGFIYLFSQS